MSFLVLRPILLVWMQTLSGYGFVKKVRGYALWLSTGATPTSRNRLKESAFLSLEVPLPPVAQQQRLVAHVEALANQLREAQRLRNDVAQERNALCRSVLATDNEAQLVPMADLVALRAPDVAVRPDETYQFAGVYSFGRGVFRAQAKSGVEFAYPKLTTLKTGNFTYPKLMAWEGALVLFRQNATAALSQRSSQYSR
ncbi:MAG: hypothetical protein IPJ52_12380 [Rhodocyclaceae bacterium]|nr:hypothetical protein [Rhodocyclaceae bacterium]